MSKQNDDFPSYYDGSSHLDVSEEIAPIPRAEQSEEQASPDEWRRYIGANPFGRQQ